MRKVRLHGKEFELFISEAEISRSIKKIAEDISKDLQGKSRPLFISVLNGSFMFTADLMKHISIESEVSK